VGQNLGEDHSIRAAGPLSNLEAGQLFAKGALRQVLVAGLYPYLLVVRQAFQVWVSIARRQL
jgi:hypothetical protein